LRERLLLDWPVFEINSEASEQLTINQIDAPIGRCGPMGRPWRTKYDVADVALYT
jgi:hypothetical protein